MTIDRKQAFHDILDGHAEVPFLTSAWAHFVGSEYGPAELAGAHIDFVERWDWDWVKINPRSAYYPEAWGAVFDQFDYGGGKSPRLERPVILRPEDTAGIRHIDVESSQVFREQVAAAAQIADRFDDRVVIQTVFSPLTVLYYLASLPRVKNKPVYGPAPTVTIESLLFEQPDAAKSALLAIAKTLADYVRLLVAPRSQGGAGVDGIFYAVTGTVAKHYLTREQYREFGEPFDRIVLDAVRDASSLSAGEAGAKIRLLHTCQDYSNPDWFVGYPVDVLQWDQFLAGNPKPDELIGAPGEWTSLDGRVADLGVHGPVPVLGPESRLLGASTDIDELRRELRDVVEERVGRPFLLAPSCTLPGFDDSRLRLLRETTSIEAALPVDAID
ncbi:uroporphyrinogen decarboxylase family protein [Bifidobacterium choloepi]|uniref:Uroporphyrinogen decarboxylase n=1 Tax=Bifidobacterium choloepi TaxID=2614131 RepID=A0A6I5MZF3_9BIFI|nr:uroporphyrinogen decarboxylase family protein [Bifidobacterium choloepi]NEG69596.1 uroporphyrinogen decarboxylase [Bifidobacterium choloepi]